MRDMKRSPLAIMLYARGSQTEIARAAGCSTTYISSLAAGRIKAPMNKMRDIARAAHVDLGDFIKAYWIARRDFLKGELAEADTRLREPVGSRRAS